jgi:hypothetical protein
VRLPWPFRRRTSRSAPPAPVRRNAHQPPSIGEAELQARLRGDPSLRGDLDTATWAPIEAWLCAAIHALALQRPNASEADAAYRALRDSALLLGDVLVGGTATPDFSQSLEGIEAYLTPYFSQEMERAFPALLEEAQREQRLHASRPQASAALAGVLRRAFEESGEAS